MVEKKIKITIDTKGGYILEAKEGFAGTSCAEQTRCIELSLGGQEVGEGKTEDYYKPDDDSVSIKFD